MKKMSVFIGRFQPPHKAHIDIISNALENSENVLILIGSSFKARDIRNPFNHIERSEMILRCFDVSIRNKLHFGYISDNPYNDLAWVKEVQKAVDNTYNQLYGWYSSTPDITLIGHHKDMTSYYLDLFPSWKQEEVSSIFGMDSTYIRELFFESISAMENKNQKIIARQIHKGVMDYMVEFMYTNIDYDTLVKETEFIKNYKLQWSKAPYAPTFVTADAVVTNMGHVLLVQRKAAPGEGLWALPGGFLDQFETVEECAIRELKEETGIKVPEAVLRGSIKREKRYDHPTRSLRGRTITTAFHFDLHDKTMPKVRGSDDAAKAKWVPLNEFIRKQDEMYEDHYSIICDLLGLG